MGGKDRAEALAGEGSRPLFANDRFWSQRSALIALHPDISKVR